MAFMTHLQQAHSIKVDQAEFSVVEIQEAPIMNHGHGHYSVIIDHIPLRVEVLEHNASDRSFLIKIGQIKHNAHIVREIDRMVADMGLETHLSKKADHIISPMPGMIKKVYVSVGDEVVVGQSLIVLEAMKMENVIKSPIDAKIKSIHFRSGEAVDKSEILIRFME
ncbi:MAG: acetyl-CoA carboxylase biotin carboxyl carrier protein subunit [Saprospiraceae bacterium]|nr:acetyl-CoA carboxylase biotin carboxyl carrier protein subunit [Saprospiraceae bacterium]